MGGGSYDYVYMKVLDFAAELRGTDNNPMRKAFADHLVKVAGAMLWALAGTLSVPEIVCLDEHNKDDK